MPDTSLYHVPKGMRLTGALNIPALEQALNHLVARHEALRTSFATVDGVPVTGTEQPQVFGGGARGGAGGARGGGQGGAAPQGGTTPQAPRGQN